MSDFQSIKQAVLDHKIDLLLFGPEVPLVEGIHDLIAKDSELSNLKVVGPKKVGAQLEGSKDLPKNLCSTSNPDCKNIPL